MVVITSSEMVENAAFIHLKMSTRSTKTVKEEAKQWSNDTSFELNPKN
jgi:hypothetical protein